MAGFGMSGSIIVVSMLGQIIAVPILLTYWGGQRYGEWVVLISLVASFSVLNLGVQSYAGNRMISCYVRGDGKEGARVLHAALRLYLILCGLALLATSFLVWWPQTLSWLQIQIIPPRHARIIIGIQGVMATYAIIGGLLMGLFRVIKQYPRQLTYSLAERVILLGSPLVVAWLGGWPLHASVMVGILMAGVACVALQDVVRRTPYPIGLASASWGDAVSLLPPSITFFGVSIATTLLSTGMIIVISKTSGALAVTVFTTTLMLTNVVRIVIQQGLNVLWPEITATAAHTGMSGRMLRWHRLVLKLVCFLALLGSSAIVLLGPDVLTLWTRGKIQIDVWLNLLLAVYLLIQAPALVSGVFGLATNRQKDMLRVHVVITVISMVVAWFLLSSFGIWVAAIALTVAQVIGTIWILGLACRWTSDHYASLVRDIFIRGLPSVIVVFFGVSMIWLLTEGFLGKLMAVIVIDLIATFVAWRFWLTAAERGQITSKLNEGFLILRRRQNTGERLA